MNGTGKTEWKVRIGSLATYAGSLLAVVLIETRAVPVVEDLPTSIKVIVLPLLVAAAAWFSGRAARSKPDYLAPSTVEAVRTHLQRNEGSSI